MMKWRKQCHFPQLGKSPGPHSHKHHLHVSSQWNSSLVADHVPQSAFKKYVMEKEVMITWSSSCYIPFQVSAAFIHLFNQDGNLSPDINNVTLDWTTSLPESSAWNQEMVHLLSADFQQMTKEGDYSTVIYNNLTSIQALCDICYQKPSQTHQACQEQAMIEHYPLEVQEAIASRQHAV